MIPRIIGSNLDRRAPGTYPVGMENDRVLIFGKDT